MAVDARTLELIKQKAASGQALSAPTAEKQAIYDSYKPFDQAAHTKQMQDQVNSIYDQQKQAQLANFYTSRDRSIGQVNQQKAEVAPQYQSARNQSDVVSAQNTQRLREMMASNGLQSSGENVTANVGLQNARQNSLNGLNLQEQQTMNDFNRQISDLNDPAHERALIASLEAQRAQALFDSGMRADEMGYNRGRDSIMDRRYDNEFTYNQGRDTIGDKQWQSQFDYGKTRDAVGDSQWLQQFNYNKQQDALSRALKSVSKGGGGSSSYAVPSSVASLPKNPVKSSIMTQQQYIDAFEEPAARKAGTARVIPGSTDYIKKMQLLMKDLYK